MKLELCHVDTCLPDYWGGHHRAHVQIPVWRGMSLKAIKEAVKSELRDGAVLGSDELALLLSADRVPEGKEKDADRATRAAYAAVNRLKPAVKGTRVSLWTWSPKWMISTATQFARFLYLWRCFDHDSLFFRDPGRSVFYVQRKPLF